MDAQNDQPDNAAFFKIILVMYLPELGWRTLICIPRARLGKLCLTPVRWLRFFGSNVYGADGDIFSQGNSDANEDEIMADGGGGAGRRREPRRVRGGASANGPRGRDDDLESGRPVGRAPGRVLFLVGINPLGPPLIDPGYLTSEFDLFAAREGLKRAQRFVTAPAFKDYIIAPTVDLGGFTSDELDQFIRNITASTSHLVGSAGMSVRDASYGVVDPDLLVKGASGLRIIDASVLNAYKPIVPSAHTQAATYIIAERGADLVKASWR
ncbi:GMC oxidoreductase-domain-containing protein [Mycena rosella]|uniref:GMC oxidoreductase-domain-containing protein n=1 Tax=Mycena rosella TaxID=1033263 RepID=A0AAD7G4A7_MYCRO|nr:GMC oxidoreductase-domain-containing protein [Mycena rosella]